MSTIKNPVLKSFNRINETIESLNIEAETKAKLLEDLKLCIEFYAMDQNIAKLVAPLVVYPDRLVAPRDADYYSRILKNLVLQRNKAYTAAAAEDSSA